MRRITLQSREPLFDTALTRHLEACAQANLPPHTLMDRAGLAVARMVAALAPHGRTIWIACGPGNNGGDGLQAAAHLMRWRLEGRGAWQIHVTHTLGPDPDADRLPADARHALAQARAAGATLQATPPAHADLVVDALLGIGARQAPQGVMNAWLTHMHSAMAPVLAVDVPSGLAADTGTWSGPALSADAPERHTLSLLTLKPGLFTGHGRDAAGQIWFDDLGIDPPVTVEPTAWLSPPGHWYPTRPHSSHKGSWGDVVVIGGQHIGMDGTGMTGAGVLAARAALESGAGRVYLAMPGDPVAWDPGCPELMLRTPERAVTPDMLSQGAVVCGCGGGQSILPLLPAAIRDSQRLVLDADALNAVSADTRLADLVQARLAQGKLTVLTPHPLEAARLLGCTTSEVMGDRIAAARALSSRLGAICVLKGSGSVIAALGQPIIINSSGNARLATAGTGDVLAGMIGAMVASASPADALQRVCAAVARHGELADHWHPRSALLASRLAQAIGDMG
ncbi:MAG: NAD(P)H-hydrate dehydratase [Burkholderiaceae bacterium]